MAAALPTWSKFTAMMIPWAGVVVASQGFVATSLSLLGVGYAILIYHLLLQKGHSCSTLSLAVVIGSIIGSFVAWYEEIYDSLDDSETWTITAAVIVPLAAAALVTFMCLKWASFVAYTETGIWFLLSLFFSVSSIIAQGGTNTVTWVIFAACIVFAFCHLFASLFFVIRGGRKETKQEEQKKNIETDTAIAESET